MQSHWVYWVTHLLACVQWRNQDISSFAKLTRWVISMWSPSCNKAAPNMWEIIVTAGHLQWVILWTYNLNVLTFKKVNAGFADGGVFADSNHSTLNVCDALIISETPFQAVLFCWVLSLTLQHICGPYHPHFQMRKLLLREYKWFA